jgi:hypothetical protein
MGFEIGHKLLEAFLKPRVIRITANAIRRYLAGQPLLQIL